MKKLLPVFAALLLGTSFTACIQKAAPQVGDVEVNLYELKTVEGKETPVHTSGILSAEYHYDEQGVQIAKSYFHTFSGSIVFESTYTLWGRSAEITKCSLMDESGKVVITLDKSQIDQIERIAARAAVSLKVIVSHTPGVAPQLEINNVVVLNSSRRSTNNDGDEISSALSHL